VAANRESQGQRQQPPSQSPKPDSSPGSAIAPRRTLPRSASHASSGVLCRATSASVMSRRSGRPPRPARRHSSLSRAAPLSTHQAVLRALPEQTQTHKVRSQVSRTTGARRLGRCLHGKYLPGPGASASAAASPSGCIPSPVEPSPAAPAASGAPAAARKSRMRRAARCPSYMQGEQGRGVLTQRQTCGSGAVLTVARANRGFCTQATGRSSQQQRARSLSRRHDVSTAGLRGVSIRGTAVRPAWEDACLLRWQRKSEVRAPSVAIPAALPGASWGRRWHAAAAGCPGLSISSTTGASWCGRTAPAALTAANCTASPVLGDCCKFYHSAPGPPTAVDGLLGGPHGLVL
jgi:hypothetical protein